MHRFLKTKWFRIFSGTIFYCRPRSEHSSFGPAGGRSAYFTNLLKNFHSSSFGPAGGRSAYFTNLLKNFHSSSPVSMSCSPHACLPPTIS